MSHRSMAHEHRPRSQSRCPRVTTAASSSGRNSEPSTFSPRPPSLFLHVIAQQRVLLWEAFKEWLTTIRYRQQSSPSPVKTACSMCTPTHTNSTTVTLTLMERPRGPTVCRWLEIQLIILISSEHPVCFILLFFMHIFWVWPSVFLVKPCTLSQHEQHPIRPAGLHMQCGEHRLAGACLHQQQQLLHMCLWTEETVTHQQTVPSGSQLKPHWHGNKSSISSHWGD